MGDLILDPSIRDWVVLPMVLVMVLVGLVRHYATLLMKSTPKSELNTLKQMQTLKRAQMLRGNGKFVRTSSIAQRVKFFVASEKEDGYKGILCEKQPKSNAMNPMMNPDGMTNMLKGNMTMMLPNMLMMGLISYFFAGFVLVKVPFSLTQEFKEMFQRGVELKTLDVSYVSSLSWYFLVMFGMRGFLSLILGEQSAHDDTQAMQAQMGMGMNQPGFDATKAFKQERDNLRLHDHDWELQHMELKYLGEKIPEKPKASEQSYKPEAPTGKVGKKHRR